MADNSSYVVHADREKDWQIVPRVQLYVAPPPTPWHVRTPVRVAYPPDAKDNASSDAECSDAGPASMRWYYGRITSVHHGRELVSIKFDTGEEALRVPLFGIQHARGDPVLPRPLLPAPPHPAFATVLQQFLLACHGVCLPVLSRPQMKMGLKSSTIPRVTLLLKIAAPICLHTGCLPYTPICLHTGCLLCTSCPASMLNTMQRASVFSPEQPQVMTEHVCPFSPRFDVTELHYILRVRFSTTR